MTTRNFVLTIRVVYVLDGTTRLLPALVSGPPLPQQSVGVDSAYGYLFGLFP